MWARLVVAPWWVRWLVNASVLTVVLFAMLACVIPDFVRGGWVWPFLCVLGASLIMAALMTFAQRPVFQSYKPAVAGLSLSQRKHAIRALRTGEAPADPQVLAAAVRIGNLSRAYHGRVPDWQRKVAWCIPALWVVAGILEFVGHNARAGITWMVPAVLVAGRMAWATYRVRRLPQGLERLRAAADSSPEALSTLEQAQDSVAGPPALKIRLASMAVILVAVIVVCVVVYQRARPSPDCRTADKVVNYIHDHPDMLDGRLISPDGPGLDKYQGWSDQLVAYSRQVSAPDLAPHLQRIAQISADAVSVVAEVRRDPAINQSTHELLVRQLVYQGIVGHLIDEDKALIPPCHHH
jgi:hypothetical protein